MRLLFVADGRSPTALNWIQYFIQRGDEVHLVSTFPAEPLQGLASYRLVPAAFSSAASVGTGTGGRLLRRFSTPLLRTLVRQWLGTATLRKAGENLASAIAAIEPDLVHAMRIPFEGMIAALALRTPAIDRVRRPLPLLVSVWGNDFTLHAAANRGMAGLTRLTLASAQALHTDCRRDARLAADWSYPSDRPAIVLPGGGGVQMSVFYPGETPPASSGGRLTIIQPRGSRAYVQNEAFFRAIPAILARHPGTRVVCPGMESSVEIRRLVAKLGLQASVSLLPQIPRAAMADWFRRSDILCSPTTHDGTPNTLLEGMACGCFPVAGDLESIREWIEPGENGILVDAGDPGSIAAGLIRAIEDPALRNSSRPRNLALIRERAVYENVMASAGEFYTAVTA